MYLTRKTAIRAFLVTLLFLTPYVVNAIYVPSARDTSVDPVEMAYTIENVDELTFLHTAGDLSYYYRETTDVITIVDNRNGYTWKTGVDKMPALEVADQCSVVTKAYEDQLNSLDFSSFGNWSVDAGLTRATFDVDGQEQFAKVSLSGLQNTHAVDEISVTYDGLNLQNGTEYQLSFDNRVSQEKTVNVRVGTMDGAVFTEISSTQLLLTKDVEFNFQNYTFSFDMTAPSTNDGVIIIEMGYIVPEEAIFSVLTFDNFMVEEFDGAAVIADTDQFSQGGFSVLDENLTVKKQDVLEGCVNKEMGLNEQFFMPWANSLISIEYFKELLNGGSGVGISRTSSTSTYQVTTESLLLDDVADPSHKIFKAYFKLRDNTLPPVALEGYVNVDNERVAIDFLYEGAACPEGQVPVNGSCTVVDPICELGLKPLDGVCIEPDEGDIVEITIYVHVYLEDTGLRFVVNNEEMEGNGLKGLASISIAPFMGAAGGKEQVFDFDELKYGNTTDKYLTPGYSFVPDGSGSLIRFKNQTVELDSYIADVYGMNYTQAENFELLGFEYVPLKTASMPVFGMVHGQNQNAYLAYASSGDEYMKIISTPDEGVDNLYYNFTYAIFEYNKKFEQVYTQDGYGGYFDVYEEPNDFDIELQYNFLQGDGTEDGYAADYVGMAKLYRDILLENGDLHLMETAADSTPIRLDFFMADSEQAILGYKNAVATDVDGVSYILDKILARGITNINSGLIGWNDGGATLGDPSDTDFTSQIGKKGEFEDLIKKYQKSDGIDISFVNDYFHINEEQMNLRTNAAKHTNNWYSRIYTINIPIYEFYFARPVKSIEWLTDHANDFDKLGVTSYTLKGISNNLISEYNDNDDRIDSLEIISNGVEKLDDDKLINAYQPNSYFWKYTDRYIDMPVFSSQHLVESDTVPFLQLVLHGTMELYAPYSNFSFYTDNDVLRMIDYNVNPSFVLTKEPSHILSDTNSKNFYSTEYNLYLDLIDSIYGKVNKALTPTLGAEWIGREVYENGVIVNTYSNGVTIIINYKEEYANYNGTIVDPVSFKVMGGE